MTATQKNPAKADRVTFKQPTGGGQVGCSTNGENTLLRTIDSFDWSAHYRNKAQAFTSCARTWRQIAHTAQLAGEGDVVAMAITNAIENEILARESEHKSIKQRT